MVPRPKGQKVIRGKWVHNIKVDRDGNRRYKARWVICGNEQTQGIDFDETFAPVIRFETLRAVLL